MVQIVKCFADVVKCPRFSHFKGFSVPGLSKWGPTQNSRTHCPAVPSPKPPSRKTACEQGRLSPSYLIQFTSFPKHKVNSCLIRIARIEFAAPLFSLQGFRPLWFVEFSVLSKNASLRNGIATKRKYVRHVPHCVAQTCAVRPGFAWVARRVAGCRSKQMSNGP